MVTELERFSQAFESEADLRNQLATLLTKMGNEGVQITHGTQEYGKDIIFYSLDGFGSRVLNACVVKKDKINGSADDNHGARNVFNQVEQALDTAHINGAGQDELVAKVFVISPFDCSQPTLRSIQGKLKTRSNQIDYLCGSRLLEKFAQHWPEFLAFESSFLGSYVASLQKVSRAE